MISNLCFVHSIRQKTEVSGFSVEQTDDRNSQCSAENLMTKAAAASFPIVN